VLRSAADSNRLQMSTMPIPARVVCRNVPLTDPGTRLKFVEDWHKLIQRSEPATPISVNDRIAVWLAPVQTLAGASSYQPILSGEDLIAINQITSSPVRSCAIAGRILLRIGLSHAVNGRLAPEHWRILISGNGKPVIGRGQPNMHFSISHTDQVAVVAISDKLPVGIDVESVEHVASNELIAGFCCPSEQALLTRIPPHQRSREFIRLWTLKEAYSKMIGLGHSMDFSSLGFSLDSLNLLHGKQGDLPPPHIHFETMWISTQTMLHHLSLAIDFSASEANYVDLQVITPTTLVGSESAIVAPSITLNTSGNHHESSRFHAF
jgi:phosphopantetheinyl transferase